VSPARVKADTSALAASIEQHGLLVPPCVMVKDRQVILLGGSRRVAASAALGKQTIEAFWVGSAQEFAEWLEADAKARTTWASAAAKPMTWTEVGIWYDRSLKLLPRGNFTTAFCENVPANRGDVQGAAFIVRTMRDHEDERVRRYARAVMAEVESGVRKPHAAVRYVREYALAPGGPSAKIDAAEQAKIITNLQGQVAGLISALELLIPVHPELADSARKTGGETLANLGRVVTRVGRVLRTKEDPTDG
jgi:ParB-like nuclease family protein